MPPRWRRSISFWKRRLRLLGNAPYGGPTSAANARYYTKRNMYIKQIQRAKRELAKMARRKLPAELWGRIGV